MKLPETIRAAFVIARRDFTATVLSKTFLLFLLGPLFPVLMGAAFGGIGARIEQGADRPVVAVIAAPHEQRTIPDNKYWERSDERCTRRWARATW